MSRKRRIELVRYDADWTRRYIEKAVRLTPIIEDALHAMHPIGSTAVRGLAAKPTIEVMIIVAPDAIITEFEQVMSALGYDCRGECLDAEIPGTRGRFYYVRRERDGVTHLSHVHVMAQGHPEIAPPLLRRTPAFSDATAISGALLG